MLDQTSAHALTDSLVTAVSKITDSVHATRKLGIACAIISCKALCARDSHAVRLLGKLGGTHVNAALLSQSLVIEDFYQIFAAKHVKISMSVKRFQRSVPGGGV